MKQIQNIIVSLKKSSFRFVFTALVISLLGFSSLFIASLVSTKAQANLGTPGGNPSPFGNSDGTSDEAPRANSGSRTNAGSTAKEEINKFQDGVNSTTANQALFQKTGMNHYLSFFICETIGCPTNSSDIAGTNSSGSTAVVPFLGTAIAYMYTNPPATSEQYIAYILDNAGITIAQPAYAQVGGLGFSSLLPILDTWVRMRNVAYLFFVFMFVVIGFMIMFRQKLGGQTVVSIQQAIPQIIISLLAVTFSFAIAGLLIDLMYLSMYLLLFLFGKTTNNEFFTGSIFTIGAQILAVGVQSVGEAVDGLVKSVLGDYALSNVISTIGGLGAMAIFALIITIKLFQLFFDLLSVYVNIIISIVTAPIALMLGAVPGKSHFSTWIKGLIGNLSTFPAVLFVLLLFQSLTENRLTDGSSGGFVPPYIGGYGSGSAITNLIALGIIIILPTIVKEIRGAMGAKEGVFNQFTKAINTSLKEGQKGGELIPGLGFTNTGNYGISGGGATKFGYNQAKGRFNQWNKNRQLDRTAATKPDVTNPFKGRTGSPTTTTSPTGSTPPKKNNTSAFGNGME